MAGECGNQCMHFGCHGFLVLTALRCSDLHPGARFFGGVGALLGKKREFFFFLTAGGGEMASASLELS